MLELFIVSKYFPTDFFLRHILGDFTGYPRSSFPYMLASKDDQSIFSVDSVPDGFILIDPDHLNAFKINSLYNHWLTRQKKGLAPFVILEASPMHEPFRKKSKKTVKAKGKGKMKYVEVNSDEAEVEGSDGSAIETDDEGAVKDGEMQDEDGSGVEAMLLEDGSAVETDDEAMPLDDGSDLEVDEVEDIQPGLKRGPPVGRPKALASVSGPSKSSAPKKIALTPPSPSLAGPSKKAPTKNVRPSKTAPSKKAVPSKSTPPSPSFSGPSKTATSKNVKPSKTAPPKTRAPHPEVGTKRKREDQKDAPDVKSGNSKRRKQSLTK
jgi:hypothetical protein